MKNLHLILSLILSLVCFQSQAQSSEEITFTHEGHTVNGTLTFLQDVPSPKPVIIIGPGTGMNDRDLTFPVVGGNANCLFPGLVGDTLRSAKQLAEGLSKFGYAVLRYDKLEYTYSFNELAPLTFEKLWLPVNSAIDYVKTRNDIDTTNIVLLGHSEGSSLIPYIAKNRQDVKALISLAGPSSSFDSLLAYQFLYIARECNGDTTLAMGQGNQIIRYFDIVRDQAWDSSTPPLFGLDPPIWYDYVQVTDDVSGQYNEAALPTLFISLGEDYNVPPSEIDVFEQRVTTPADFYRLPGLIHQMTPTNDPNVSLVLIDTIIDWLRSKNVVGIEESVSNISQVKIYPNPARASFEMSFDAKEGDAFSWALHTILGVTVAEGETDRRSPGSQRLQVNLPPELTSGIYFCTLKSQRGPHTITRKVWVQK